MKRYLQSTHQAAILVSQGVTKKVIQVVELIDIEYESQKLKAVMGDLSQLERKIGKDIARSVKKRMDSFRAATSYEDILTLGLGKPHALTGDMKDYWAIHVAANIRLIYQVKDDAICLKGVCDYHGEKQNWLVP